MRSLTGVRRLLAALAALLLCAGLGTALAGPAGAWGAYLCSGYGGCGGAGYTDYGYGAASGTSYWGMYPGHNCTNYVAYRLIQRGVDASYFQSAGDATNWAGAARAHGVAVDGNPQVGDVAWWAANSLGVGPQGHVAIVEAVGPNGDLTLSEDNYGGDFHWVHYWPGGGYYPGAFLHIHASPAGRAGTVSDVNDDGLGDIVGVKGDGSLWYYQNGLPWSAGMWPYGGGRLVGSGWNDFRLEAFADVSGDGYADIVGIRNDGTLRYYRNAGPNAAYPWDGGRQISAGWGGYTRLLAGDVDGDGRADLLATDANGAMWEFPNTGNPINPFGARRFIGGGWQGMRQVFLGDVDGDGRADLVAVDPAGTLQINRSINGLPNGPGVPIGTGWAGFTAVTCTNVDGNRGVDILAVSADGGLWLYPNAQSGNVGQPYFTIGRKIGYDWQSFRAVG